MARHWSPTSPPFFARIKGIFVWNNFRAVLAGRLGHTIIWQARLYSVKKHPIYQPPLNGLLLHCYYLLLPPFYSWLLWLLFWACPLQLLKIFFPRITAPAKFLCSECEWDQNKRVKFIAPFPSSSERIFQLLIFFRGKRCKWSEEEINKKQETWAHTNLFLLLWLTGIFVFPPPSCSSSCCYFTIYPELKIFSRKTMG